MRIILKFLLRNIMEKKFNTIIVLLSISISSALYFASFAVSDTMVKISSESLYQYYGNSDIVIKANERSEKQFFSLDNTKEFTEDTEYIKGAVESEAIYIEDSVTEKFSLLGIGLDDLNEINPFQFKEKGNIEPFSGNKIVISEKTAEKYNFELNDKIILDVAGKEHEFIVSAIARSSGIFKEYGMDVYGVVPKEELELLYDENGKSNMAFIKVKQGVNKQQTIKSLSGKYSDYVVGESVSKDEIDEQAGPIATTFLMLTILITVLSVFIIYSSFKVISLNRIKMMGVFRSVGATKKTTTLVLLGESCIYGIIGGFLGCIIGLGFLKGMSYIITPDWLKEESVTMVYKTWQLGVAFLGAIILSCISSMIPILKISRISIKDIILEKTSDNVKEKQDSIVKVIILSVLIICTMLLPKYMTGSIALPVNLVCLVVLMVLVILIISFIIKKAANFLKVIFTNVCNNEGIIAMKNLGEDKNILTNITLLSIGISVFLLVNVATHSSLTEIQRHYVETPQFTLFAWTNKMDKNLEVETKNIEGVKDAQVVYSTENLEIGGTSRKITLLEGADPDRYFDFWNIKTDKSRDELMKEIDNGKNILLTNMLKRQLGVDVGDSITLKMKSGDVKYKVIGFLNTNMESGSYAVISSNNLKNDMELDQYSKMYIKTDDTEKKNVQNRFIQKYGKSKPIVRIMSDIADKDYENNINQYILVKGFILLALVVSVLSVTNNLLISFIERKRYLAIYKSVGMSTRQMMKMVFLESLISGVFGALIGIVEGLMLLFIAPYVLGAVDKELIIHFSNKELIKSFLVGVTITTLASISPILKTSKFKIIEALKYE